MVWAAALYTMHLLCRKIITLVFTHIQLVLYCRSVRMIGWWRGVYLVYGALVLVQVCADKKHDYLQPYKFVKPLDDLSLFAAAHTAEKTADDTEMLVAAESRLGKPAPTKKDEEAADNEAEEGTAEPEPEPESEPEPTKYQNANRRGELDLEDEIFDDDTLSLGHGQGEQIDRMSNHQTEIFVDDVAEARKLVRLPPRPGDEYYYYYDDEYYYDDYLPNLPLAPPAAPPKQEKKRKDPNRPRQNLRPPAPRPSSFEEKPRTPTKQASISKPKVESKKSEAPKRGSFSRRPQRPRFDNTRRQYSIQSTINRLKGLKDNPIQRKGKPSISLPNPWRELKLPPLPELSLPK